jgi:arsenate reductase
MVMQALDEIGVPMIAEFPKSLTDEVVRAADFMIAMGCGDACPIYPDADWTGQWLTHRPSRLPVPGQQ